MKDKRVPLLPETQDLSEVLSACYKEFGYTQEELAEQAGISQPGVSRIVGRNKKALKSIKYDEAAKLNRFFLERMCQTLRIGYQPSLCLLLSESGVSVIGTEPTPTEKYDDGRYRRKGLSR